MSAWALWREPSNKSLLIQGRGASCSPDPGQFFVLPFGESMDNALWINARGEYEDLEILQPSPNLPPQPTCESDYLRNLQTLIAQLKQRGHAKTVISTVAIMPAPASLPQMWNNLQRNCPGLFCSCFYHPEVGTWIGATPELLFEIDLETLRFKTMALAGTLPKGETWDQKNIEENQIVSRFIVQSLSDLGIGDINVSPRRTLDYGQLQHLLVEISGTLPLSISPYAVVDALNPTPALCGYPRDAAMADIARFERHSRLCYGGCIGVITPSSLKVYVNIRCAQIFPGEICVYSGGGIMPSSSPSAEWAEACAKRLAIAASLS